MTMELPQLPFEIISMIAQQVDIEDAFNLGCTCKRMAGLFRDSCKRLLLVSLDPRSLDRG